MGLDIYAGTLTRYYTQNWKTAVQQFGEAHGIPVQIIRANPEEHPADEAEVLERVTEWRKHILNGLGITEPPLWNEDANQTPLLDRQAGLGWYHCFAAVCVGKDVW